MKGPQIRVLSFALMTLLLFSCERVQGDLNAFEELELNLSRSRQLKLTEGTYQSRITIKNRRIRMNLKKDDGSEQRIVFRLPRKTNIPTENGSFRISADDMNQNYDIDGNVETYSERGERIEGRERCFVRVARSRICFPGHPRHGGGCRVVVRHVPGWRQYAYYNQTDYRDFQLAMLTPGTQHIKANFIGEERRTRRIYIYRDHQCRIF